MSNGLSAATVKALTIFKQHIGHLESAAGPTVGTGKLEVDDSPGMIFQYFPGQVHARKGYFEQ